MVGGNADAISLLCLKLHSQSRQLWKPCCRVFHEFLTFIAQGVNFNGGEIIGFEKLASKVVKYHL